MERIVRQIVEGLYNCSRCDIEVSNKAAWLEREWYYYRFCTNCEKLADDVIKKYDNHKNSFIVEYMITPFDVPSKSLMQRRFNALVETI